MKTDKGLGFRVSCSVFDVLCGVSTLKTARTRHRSRPDLGVRVKVLGVEEIRVSVQNGA